MTDQGGISGSVLGVRDQVTSLLFSFHLDQHPFAILDVLLVAIIFYYAYLLIRETRAIRILYGLLTLALIYLFAQALGLVALLFLLRSIFAAIIVAIPVVFQPELRGALERIGRTRFVGLSATSSSTEQTEEVRALTQAVMVLSGKKTGALIVIEQHDRLKEIAATGISLHATLSSELLLSIFMNHSPLHDGAVIVRGQRIDTASALLPVTKDKYDASIGTRHRAAIGITQETDAVAIVVSEESGKISLAREGQLIRSIKPEDFEIELLKLLTEPQSSTLTSIVQRFRKQGKHVS